MKNATGLGPRQRRRLQAMLGRGMADDGPSAHETVNMAGTPKSPIQTGTRRDAIRRQAIRHAIRHRAIRHATTLFTQRWCGGPVVRLPGGAAAL